MILLESHKKKLIALKSYGIKLIKVKEKEGYLISLLNLKELFKPYGKITEVVKETGITRATIHNWITVSTPQNPVWSI